jgi:hypothetical protein
MVAIMMRTGADPVCRNADATSEMLQEPAQLQLHMLQEPASQGAYDLPVWLSSRLSGMTEACCAGQAAEPAYGQTSHVAVSPRLCNAGVISLLAAVDLTCCVPAPVPPPASAATGT